MDDATPARGCTLRLMYLLLSCSDRLLHSQARADVIPILPVLDNRNKTTGRRSTIGWKMQLYPKILKCDGPPPSRLRHFGSSCLLLAGLPGGMSSVWHI